MRRRCGTMMNDDARTSKNTFTTTMKRSWLKPGNERETPLAFRSHLLAVMNADELNELRDDCDERKPNTTKAPPTKCGL